MYNELFMISFNFVGKCKTFTCLRNALVWGRTKKELRDVNLVFVAQGIFEYYDIVFASIVISLYLPVYIQLVLGK